MVTFIECRSESFVEIFKINIYFFSALASLCSEMTKTLGTTLILIWEAQVKL